MGALAAGLGCFPFDNGRSRSLSHSGCREDAFAVWRRLVGGEAPAQHQCSTSSSRISPGCTSMHFGENQLSPLSIGISPLPTAHPSGLQSTPVRASTPCYRRFTLAMGSSSGFGSTLRDNRPLQTRVRCGSGCNCLNLATKGNSPDHTPKGTPLARLAPFAFDCMEAYGFRYYFTPLAGVLFTVPSRYYALSVAACV